MGQALYRKHRPKKLSEVVGQEHITKTLEQAIKQGRISHAYLLTGPRGVGKTSIARILAHEINGLPYDDDSSHIDIIEIDAASNRRIDEIRELRDKVFIAPTSSKYKVYIIDEVHMLTREAFNALLKTLEEPPEHAIFILATTDAHKLPETIISRTQRFSFKPVAQDKVVTHLAEIANGEKIQISPEALELLADHGEGSFRDSISLLDQASAAGAKVEQADVQRLLGLPPQESLRALVAALSVGTGSADLLHIVDDLYRQGYQAGMVASQLGKIIRQDLIAGTSDLSRERTLRLLEKLIAVPASHDPDHLLEIVLLDNTAEATRTEERPDRSDSPPSRPAPAAAVKPAAVARRESRPAAEASDSLVLPETSQDSEEPKVAQATEESPASREKKPTVDTRIAGKLDEASWQEVLQALKQKHNTLYGLIRTAEPQFTDGHVQLKVAFAFHQKRLSESANRQRLLDIIEEVSGQRVAVECLLDPDASPPARQTTASPPGPTPGSNEVATVSNIFGGGELLES